MPTTTTTYGGSLAKSAIRAVRANLSAVDGDDPGVATCRTRPGTAAAAAAADTRTRAAAGTGAVGIRGTNTSD
jgi:hypothetical protein